MHREMAFRLLAEVQRRQQVAAQIVAIPEGSPGRNEAVSDAAASLDEAVAQLRDYMTSILGEGWDICSECGDDDCDCEIEPKERVLS
jgi:hypothetical protein